MIKINKNFKNNFALKFNFASIISVRSTPYEIKERICIRIRIQKAQETSGSRSGTLSAKMLFGDHFSLLIHRTKGIRSQFVYPVVPCS
jgi:hypothetical protein